MSQNVRQPIALGMVNGHVAAAKVQGGNGHVAAANADHLELMPLERCICGIPEFPGPGWV